MGWALDTVSWPVLSPVAAASHTLINGSGSVWDLDPTRHLNWRLVLQVTLKLTRPREREDAAPRTPFSSTFPPLG